MHLTTNFSINAFNRGSLDFIALMACYDSLFSIHDFFCTYVVMEKELGFVILITFIRQTYSKKCMNLSLKVYISVKYLKII